MSQLLWKKDRILIEQFEKLVLDGDVTLQFISPSKIQCLFKDYILILEAEKVQIETLNSAYAVVHFSRMRNVQIMVKPNA